MKVFAYGSNLCRERLTKRVSSAAFSGRAKLNGYVLRFHKRSTDGSGKANAFYTGRDTDCVWGAIFECSPEDKIALDRADAEGLGGGYNEIDVTVIFEDGTNERVSVYIAEENFIDDSLKPYTWYKAYVVAGADERMLPHDYISAIKKQEAKRDPDKNRERRNKYTYT